MVFKEASSCLFFLEATSLIHTNLIPTKGLCGECFPVLLTAGSIRSINAFERINTFHGVPASQAFHCRVVSGL